MTISLSTFTASDGAAPLQARLSAKSAIALGPTAAIFYAALAPEGSIADGLAWTAYMAATASIAAIAGLIFGVPRMRADYQPAESERYLANSNLEQISDWLTKVLVGAALVQIAVVPSALGDAGRWLGKGLTVSNADAYSCVAVLYGAGVGFGGAYLWARLRLRVLLEATDRNAAEESQRERHVRTLRQLTQTPDQGEPESTEALRYAVQGAMTSVKAAPPSANPAILWVDDFPQNNTPIVSTLRELGINVELALTTTEALARVAIDAYNLIITDLGRKEDGDDRDMAGLELIKELRARGHGVPVIVYAGYRGLQHRSELTAAGATMVTNKASDLIPVAVDLAVRGTSGAP